MSTPNKRKPQSASSPGALHLRYMTGLDLGREGPLITPEENVNGKQKERQEGACEAESG